MFLECGRIYVYNVSDRVQVLDIDVPPYTGMVERVFLKDGVLVVETEERSFLWKDRVWSITTESVDLLTPDLENKNFAECAVLENELCTAAASNDKDEYFKALEKYMLFITPNLPREAVMSMWFEIVKMSNCFRDYHAEFEHIIELVGNTDECESYPDEMRMALV